MNIITRIILSVIAFGILYGLTGFIMADFNAWDWPNKIRESIVLFWVIVAIAIMFAPEDF